MAQPKLPAALANDFELVDWPGPQTKLRFGRFGVIDLETITERQARSLIRRGFTKLAEKEKPAASGSKTSTAGKDAK